MKVFDYLMRLYPADFRAEFEEEMRELFEERVKADPWAEVVGLLQGAARERARTVKVGPLTAGVAAAFLMQLLVYATLLTPAHAQPKQDAAAIDVARSIYTRSFMQMRDAKTLDDLKKLSDNLDAPEWVSIDRFGRTLMTRAQTEREFESILALKPAQRTGAMDIIWAEHRMPHG